MRDVVNGTAPGSTFFFGNLSHARSSDELLNALVIHLEHAISLEPLLQSCSHLHRLLEVVREHCGVLDDGIRACAAPGGSARPALS